MSNYGQTLTITIRMQGDAFQPEPYEQVYSILDRIQTVLHYDRAVEDHTLLDDSGLTCGSMQITGEAYDPDAEEKGEG